MNKVQLMGRLCQDPSVKYTQTGKVVASFTLAVNRDFSGENGKREADFINCVAWGKSAERIGNTVTKGQRLLVTDGRIQVRSYDAKDGSKRWTTEVIVNGFEYIEKRAEHNDNQPPTDAGAFGPEVSPEDDIPF